LATELYIVKEAAKRSVTGQKAQEHVTALQQNTHMILQNILDVSCFSIWQV
jgi:hypothetical protein